MLRFGNDKPDLRFGMEIRDVTDIVVESEFGVFANAAKSGGVIRGIVAPEQSDITRGQVDQLTDIARSFGAKGLVWIALEAGDDRDISVRSPIAKFLSEPEIESMVERLEARPGDLLLLVADQADVTATVLGRLRSHLGRELGLIDESVHAFCWVLDFPMYEWDEDNNRWEAMHHPFTSP